MLPETKNEPLRWPLGLSLLKGSVEENTGHTFTPDTAVPAGPRRTVWLAQQRGALLGKTPIIALLSVFAVMARYLFPKNS